MFRIPFDACAISLFVIPLLSVLAVQRLYAGKNNKRSEQVLMGVLFTLLMFVPGCVLTCFLIEPLYTYRGTADSAAVPRVFWIPPPASRSAVQYFKNTVYETYTLKLPEADFLAWCAAQDMVELPEGFRLFYDNFRPAESSGPQRAFRSRFVAKNGAQFRAVYFPAVQLMVYEADYW